MPAMPSWLGRAVPAAAVVPLVAAGVVMLGGVAVADDTEPTSSPTQTGPTDPDDPSPTEPTDEPTATATATESPSPSGSRPTDPPDGPDEPGTSRPATGADDLAPATGQPASSLDGRPVSATTPGGPAASSPEASASRTAAATSTPEPASTRPLGCPPPGCGSDVPSPDATVANSFGTPLTSGVPLALFAVAGLAAVSAGVVAAHQMFGRRGYPRRR